MKNMCDIDLIDLLRRNESILKSVDKELTRQIINVSLGLYHIIDNEKHSIYGYVLLKHANLFKDLNYSLI